MASIGWGSTIRFLGLVLSDGEWVVVTDPAVDPDTTVIASRRVYSTLARFRVKTVKLSALCALERQERLTVVKELTKDAFGVFLEALLASSDTPADVKQLLRDKELLDRVTRGAESQE